MAQDDITDAQKDMVRKIIAWSDMQGIDPHMALAIAFNESKLNNIPAADPTSTAFGPLQVNKATAAANNIDYEKMRASPDLALWTGIANLARHAKNPLFEEDPARILAAHRWGEGSPYAATGDPSLIPAGGATYLHDVGSMLPGGDFPKRMYTPPEEQTPAEAPIPQGNVVQEPAAGEHVLSPELLSTLGGLGGAAVGTGVVGAQAANAIRKNILGRFGTEKPVDIPRVEPIMGAEPAPLSAEISGNTPEQTARIHQGGEGGTEGTTGRARQTGYNVQTAQEAAAKKEAEAAAKLAKRAGITELEAGQFLARQPGMTASASGVVYPRSVSRPTTGARVYHDVPLATQAAQSGELPIRGGQTYTVGHANVVPPAPIPVPAAAEESGLSKAARYFGKALPVLKPIANVGLSALSGALGANQIYAAEKDREKSGLTPSNFMDYMSGTGALLGTIPTVPTRVVGGALQVPAAVRDTKRWVEENPKQVQRLVDMGAFDQIPGQP
jgi:hypothetical protein